MRRDRAKREGVRDGEGWGGRETDRQTDRVRGDRTERGEVETERRGEKAQNIEHRRGGGGDTERG